MITKVLVGAAIVLSAYGGTAPTSGAPNPVKPDPNLFSVLSCSCRETTPAGSAREEIDRGIHDGLHALLPGLPAPAAQAKAPR